MEGTVKAAAPAAPPESHVHLDNLLVYIDGQYLPRRDAKISVFDHGLLYGDGVFEGIQAYDGNVFKLHEHIDRLYDSAHYIKLPIPLTKEQLTDAILMTLRRNRLTNAYIRVIVTRGTGDLGVNPLTCREPGVIIITVPTEPNYGREQKERGVRLIISSLRRDPVDATSHEVKSLNYLNSVLAKLEALDAGVDDAILVTRLGFVSETSIANIFRIHDDEISTPPHTAGILHGITRARILRLCRDLGYPTHERDLTPYDLLSSDEVFLTGTKTEVVPVVEINHRPISTGVAGPITRHIMHEFYALVRRPEEGIPIYEAAETVPPIP